MRTTAEKTPGRGRVIRPGRESRIARETLPGGRLLVAPAALVERVGEDECRNADDERAGHDFQNAHVHLLAALQYGALRPAFKGPPWNISWNTFAG